MGHEVNSLLQSVQGIIQRGDDEIGFAYGVRSGVETVQALFKIACRVAHIRNFALNHRHHAIDECDVLGDIVDASDEILSKYRFCKFEVLLHIHNTCLGVNDSGLNWEKAVVDIGSNVICGAG
jgi:hypothetical protein